jgi:hypothetical protein
MVILSPRGKPRCGCGRMTAKRARARGHACVAVSWLNPDVHVPLEIQRFSSEEEALAFVQRGESLLGADFKSESVTITIVTDVH